MIILITTANTKYHKKVNQFCNQIAYGQLSLAAQSKNKSQIEQITQIFHRPNQDVAQKNKNKIQELVQHAWKDYRETWCIPDTETIKISFPTEVKDAWQKGQAYYIFTGSSSNDRVIRF